MCVSFVQLLSQHIMYTLGQSMEVVVSYSRELQNNISVGIGVLEML